VNLPTGQRKTGSKASIAAAFGPFSVSIASEQKTGFGSGLRTPDNGLPEISEYIRATLAGAPIPICAMEQTVAHWAKTAATSLTRPNRIKDPVERQDERFVSQSHDERASRNQSKLFAAG
jgi:hypothetical protein